jgi:hypothetical protein
MEITKIRAHFQSALLFLASYLLRLTTFLRLVFFIGALLTLRFFVAAAFAFGRCLSAAWAAASRAIGTRNGEQET